MGETFLFMCEPSYRYLALVPFTAWGGVELHDCEDVLGINFFPSLQKEISSQRSDKNGHRDPDNLS